MAENCRPQRHTRHFDFLPLSVFRLEVVCPSCCLVPLALFFKVVLPTSLAAVRTRTKTIKSQCSTNSMCDTIRLFFRKAEVFGDVFNFCVALCYPFEPLIF